MLHISIVTSFDLCPEISSIIKKSLDIVNFFSKSPVATAEFRKIQGNKSTTFIKVFINKKLYKLHSHQKLVGIQH
jgi:hypothetical protein